MNYTEYLFNLSEVGELEALLSSPDISEAEKIGLCYRLEKARKRIAGIAPPAAAVYDNADTESAAGLPLDPRGNGDGPGERSKAV